MAGEEQNAQTNAAPEQQAAAHQQRNQWIAFAILAVIMIVVVAAIALLRPLIFDKIVPAVIGDFVTPEPITIEESVPEAEQPAAETAPVEEIPGGGENEVYLPAAAGGSKEQPVEESESEPVPEETAVPVESEPVTHTVLSGDNLTKISQKYGVSVQEIMAANSLPNADYISVGQILVIPTN